MKRLLLAGLLGAMVTVGGWGCNRPGEGECKKAINNIRDILDAEPPSDAEMAAAVRSCRGNATKESVRCFTQAKTRAELRECEGDMYQKMGGKQDVEGESQKDSETPPKGSE